MSALERYFGLEAAGTRVTTEVRAGLVTFLTMSYILFVNPQILSEAGMPAGDVAVATALASAAATLAMGSLGELPICPGTGDGPERLLHLRDRAGPGGTPGRSPWRQSSWRGALFLILSVTGVRAALMRAIPTSIKIATMCGIGLLLAIIGFNSAGLIRDHPAILITLGDVRSPGVVLALLGLLVMSVLAARVPGAILIGILGVTVACWGLGISAPPESFLTLPSLPGRPSWLSISVGCWPASS